MALNSKYKSFHRKLRVNSMHMWLYEHIQMSVASNVVLSDSGAYLPKLQLNGKESKTVRWFKQIKKKKPVCR